MQSKNEKATKKFARDLMVDLKSPTVIALVGELGAGKTTFVQGLAEALNIERRVLSPTFVFLRSYNLTDSKFKKLHHFDLYRCETLSDVKNIGLEEILAEPSYLVVIEWPEVAKELLPKDTLWLNFKKISENSRAIEVS